MNEAPEPMLRALLLRRLPASESVALEDRIVLEEGFAERLELERSDLLDDYAADRLVAVDREAVERYLLRTPADRQRVALARALFNRTGSRRPRRWVLPAGAALAACLALVMVLPRLPWQAARQVPDAAVPHDPGDAATPAASPSTSAYAVTLLAEAERGAGARRIDIPAGTGLLHLQLEVPQPLDPAQGAAFHVAIRDAAGERFAAADLPAHDIGPYRIVELDVPRTAAGDGTQRVILSQGDPRHGARELFEWTVQFESRP